MEHPVDHVPSPFPPLLDRITDSTGAVSIEATEIAPHVQPPCILKSMFFFPRLTLQPGVAAASEAPRCSIASSYLISGIRTLNIRKNQNKQP